MLSRHNRITARGRSPKVARLLPVPIVMAAVLVGGTGAAWASDAASARTGGDAVAGSVRAASAVVEVSGSQEESKMSADLKTGDRLVVHLKETASTGYTWSVVSVSGGLQADGDKAIAPVLPMPGAPGGHDFYFNAVKPGPASVSFKLSRPWEPPTHFFPATFTGVIS